MKIAFLSLQGTFDFHQVGGTDAYMRRLLTALQEYHANIEIVCCFYGAPMNEKKSISPHLSVWRQTTLNQSLQDLRDYTPKHIVACYIRPQHLPALYLFQRQNASIMLHKLLFFYPENRAFRFLKKVEYSLFNYSGAALAVSDRIRDDFAVYFRNMITLPPIVPSTYFCDWENKHTPIAPFELVFLGRTDPRKGIVETIQLFEQLLPNRLFHCKIVGIHIQKDAESVRIHQQLSAQNRIPYYPVDRQKYSTETEQMVIQTLRNADIFIQPYRSLSSTVDLPLLILEAMASGCAVLTTNQKPISTLFENNPFLLPPDTFVQDAIEVLSRITPLQIRNEQMKNRHSPKLSASHAESVAQHFLEGIHETI